MPDTPPAPPAAPTPAQPAQPAKSGNRVLIIIVCVVVGFFLLIGGCVATCTYIAAKKAKEIGRAAKEHPVFTSLSIAASLNPDVQVLSKDANTGIITVRNKRTGETVTINANDFTKDNIDQALDRMTAGAKAASAAMANAGKGAETGPAAAAPASTASEEENQAAAAPSISAGKAAAMAAILAKFPDFVAAYPGGTTVEASQNVMGPVHASKYAFVTTDKLDPVIDFFQKRAVAAGFSLVSRNGDTNDYGPTANVTFIRTSPQATLSLNAEGRQGGTLQVTLEISQISN